MKGAKVLENNSRLDKGYEKYKKELYENQKALVVAKLEEQTSEDIEDR